MSVLDELHVREDIVKVAGLAYGRQYTSGYDGNITVRLARDRILCTPSGMNKGFLRPQDLLVVDLSGETRKGSGVPSSEVRMHLLVYRERPDVNAVIHAHPPHCVACTLVGISLAVPLVPETAFLLGSVPTAPYATPGTDEVPRAIEPFIKDADALLLARHGSITLGCDVWEAYNRLESLEHVAQTLFLARNLGELVPLSADEVERLRESVTARGLPWKFPGGQGIPASMVEAIVEKVLARLRGGA